MSRILVSGSIAFDRIMDYPGLFADSFVEGKLHSINVSFLIKDMVEKFGGTAGNIAYGLRRFGQEPVVIATVGSDFAPYKERLAELGIATDTIRELPDDRTAAAYIMTDQADNQIAAFHPGAGGRAYEGTVPLNTDIAIVAPGSTADMVALPQYYREHGMKYCFDPSQQLSALSPEDLRSCIQGAEILFGNDYEYALIAQKTGWDEVALRLRVGTLVITAGVEGTRILSKNAEEYVPACAVERVVDPTGAGDAQRAAFLAARTAGASLVEAARAGSVAASFCIESFGTQEYAFTRESFAERYARTYTDALPEHIGQLL